MPHLPQLIRLLALSAIVLLTGCAATVQRGPGTEPALQATGTEVRKIVLSVKGSDAAAKSADWEKLRAEWRTSMAAAAQSAGLGFAYVEKAPAVGSEAATSVVIHVNDYRYLSTGARLAFGIMTGNAFVDADASFVDLASGKALGTKKYSTSSSAWEGAFSAMTDKQLQAISKQIVTDITRK